MKITGIRTLSLSRPHEPGRQWATASVRVPKADCAILVIDTDEGVQGIAEPCAYGVPPDIAARLARLAPGLIGRDPSDPDLVPANTGERSVDIAHAGLDCALWDLKGKIAGQPVARLLAQPGKEPLTRVRLYASAGVSYDWADRPETVVEEACRLAEAGFTAYKMRPGTEWSWAGVTVSRFVALLQRVHEAVAGRMDLALDANCRLSEPDALVVARALEEMGWAWFEEPTPRDPEAWARISRATKVPVSGCEPFTTLAQFAPYLEQRAVSIIQPDAGVCGITFARDLGQRAHALGIGLIPHNWHNGLMTMANAHLVAALPEPRLVELNAVQGPLQWEILRERPAIRDGHLLLPDRPGLGVELADDLEARFPYIEGSWAAPVERRGTPATMNAIEENSMSERIPSREEALALLRRYNENPSLLGHARAVEATMRHFARLRGGDEEMWGTIGLIHDLDYERFPEQHCHRTAEILRAEGWPESWVRVTLSHGWGICTEVEPQTELEKTLYAVDELTGLVAACALVRPSKSVRDLEPRSVRKKWKQASFAAGVNRQVIEQGAAMLGVDLDELIGQAIEAMRGVADEIGL